jgi:DNA polymerase-3 subunit beta
MITVNRNELASALAFAQSGLSKRPVVPVLGGMRVSISSGTLELAAFDYEITARAKVNGPWLRGRRQESGDASILVTGAELAAVVKSLPKGPKVSAVLDISDDGLMVECEGAISLLSSLPADEYPQLPAMPELAGYVDGETFARSVPRVAVCASRDDTLPVLTHVKIGSDGGALEMAATDRYRLAIDRLHWTGPDGVSALVPAATLTALAKKLDKHGRVALHLGEGFAGFSDGTRSLITRTSDSEFIRYRERMRSEADNSTTVLVDAPALHAAVVRAGTMAERNCGVDLDVTDGQITVTAQRDGKPVSTQHVPAAIDGPDTAYRFNPGYLASVLSGIGGPAWLGFQSVYDGPDAEQREKQRPLLVTADGEEFTALVCHIRRQA